MNQYDKRKKKKFKLRTKIGTASRETKKSTLKSQATFVFRLNICQLFHFISKNALFSTLCLFYCSQEHLHSIFLKLLDLPVTHVTSKTTQHLRKYTFIICFQSLDIEYTMGSKNSETAIENAFFHYKLYDQNNNLSSNLKKIIMNMRKPIWFVLLLF